jgi:hypothetical protein
MLYEYTLSTSREDFHNITPQVRQAGVGDVAGNFLHGVRPAEESEVLCESAGRVN